MTDISYLEFYQNRPARVREYELVEIAHPNFSKTYYVNRQKPSGLTVTIDTGEHFWKFYPLAITSKGTRADLDYAIQVQLGDLGTIVPQELDAVNAADGWDIKPTVRYWTFRSDDMSAPLVGPIITEIVELSQTREGASFLATAPNLNTNRCGELYLPERFPMLSAFL